MSKRNDRVFIEDMMARIALIEEFTTPGRDLYETCLTLIHVLGGCIGNGAIKLSCPAHISGASPDASTIQKRASEYIASAFYKN